MARPSVRVRLGVGGVNADGGAAATLHEAAADDGIPGVLEKAHGVARPAGRAAHIRRVGQGVEGDEGQRRGGGGAAAAARVAAAAVAASSPPSAEALAKYGDLSLGAKLRADFPLISAPQQEVVYLDSAATSQKPRQVMDVMEVSAPARSARGDARKRARATR